MTEIITKLEQVRDARQEWKVCVSTTVVKHIRQSRKNSLAKL